ncbi:MAG: type II toxin-antitoxin system RelE/ParE family toxin [Pseudomonadota bacterium]
MTATAERDLTDIWGYIAESSPRNASTFVRELTERFEPLRYNPKIGPAREEYGVGLRAHFHRDYAIYYTYNDVDLIILHVVHGARDAAALFCSDAR